MEAVMKEIITIITVCIVANVSRGFVYSYQETASVNAETDLIPLYAVSPGPNPPADMATVGAIAPLESDITVVAGMTPAASAGEIAYGGFGPAPPGVLIGSYGAYSTPNAAALSPGDTIGPNGIWSNYGAIGGYAGSLEGIIGDPAFLSSNGAYAGIEFFDANNQIHYGWLLLRYDQPPGTFFGTIELMEAGYETDPGVAITIAPEPGAATLGVTAIFAAGLQRRRRVAWRRNKH